MLQTFCQQGQLQRILVFECQQNHAAEGWKCECLAFCQEVILLLVQVVGLSCPLEYTMFRLGGLDDHFADCIPTKTGMEFPDGDGTLSLRYSRMLPEEYAGIVLRPGFYVPEDETLESLLTYAHLRADGTAIFSIMGMEQEIEWSPEVFYFGDMIICATADGFVARDTVTVHYRYTGDTLPEHYNEGVLP